jgi:hypothetical protein
MNQFVPATNWSTSNMLTRLEGHGLGTSTIKTRF